MLDRIRDGRTDLVFELVCDQRTAMTADEDGVSLIQWCAYYGDVSAVRWLLTHGESLERLGDNFGLSAAAFHGHWRLCEFLLENGAVNGEKIVNGSVTTEKIANGAVTNSKLGADSVTAGKIQNGAVGSSSLAPSFLSQLVRNVVYVGKASGAVSATSPQSVTAECPVGKQAVGGGARVIAGDATSFQVAESIPFVAADSKRTGWTAAAQSPEAGKTFAVEAVAICAEF